MLDTNDMCARIATVLDNAKAIDIKQLDVRSLTDITDEMIICHGSSGRHVSALAQQVTDGLRTFNVSPASIEGEDLGEWILIDYIDVLVHIMKREVREYYDLESLWDKRLAPQPHNENPNIEQILSA